MVQPWKYSRAKPASHLKPILHMPSPFSSLFQHSPATNRGHFHSHRDASLFSASQEGLGASSPMVAAHSQVVQSTCCQPVYPENMSRSLSRGAGSGAPAVNGILVLTAADARSAGINAQTVRGIIAIMMWLMPKRSVSHSFGGSRISQGSWDPFTTAA